MKKWLLRFTGLILGIIVVLLVIGLINIRDRHRGYNVDIHIPKTGVPTTIKVGFAAMPITPTVVDTWNDKNGDAKFDEEDGDTYNDNNNNGKFDAFWIAGFSNKKPTNGVHDDVWARTVIFDDGNARLAIVSLDAIGFLNDDVVDIRLQIPEELGLDYVIISSTHTHESFDLIGIWGESPLKSGVNKEHLKYVKSQILVSITEAVKNLRPAKLHFAQDLTGAKGQVMDTRKPIVLDPGMRFIQAIDTENDSTLGVVVTWGNHPETLWADNLLISSDFPHYVRKFIEKGVYNNGELVMPGVGGTAVYFSGAVGGLMTTRGSMAIKSPFSDKDYTEPNFDKLKAQGQTLAMLALQALANPDSIVEKSQIAIRAKTIELPLANKVFALAAAIGIIDKGLTGFFKARSEIAVFSIGPASFICVPGEIYPEIVNGGIEAAEGQDFGIDPVEIPPLRELMPGKYKFVIGLANDEVGYIIPKSEWDVEAPYLYGAKKSPYGEDNSFGPETAPIIYNGIKQILSEL